MFTEYLLVTVSNLHFLWGCKHTENEAREPSKNLETILFSS